MRLASNLPPTAFAPLRGYGLASVPDVGPDALPVSVFLTREDVLNAPELAYRPGSAFLGRIDDKMIGLREQRHTVLFGGTRSGKTATHVLCGMLLNDNPMLVIDPKGEIAAASAVHRHKVLGHSVHILDPFGMVRGEARQYVCRHDLLREIDINSPDLVDDAAMLAEALVVPTGGDHHWVMSARNVLASLILLAKFEGQGETLPDLRSRLARSPRLVWEAMTACALMEGKTDTQRDALSLLVDQGENFRSKNENEAASIVSSALEQLAFVQSPAMRALFAGHDLDLADLKASPKDRPVTVYVVLPANRMETHNRWLRALVTLALLHFERLPTDTTRLPVILMLEEFAALGHLRPVEQAMGYIAGANVCVTCVLQDITQLRRHYKEGWETFLANAGLVLALSISDLATCEYLSKRLGDTTIRVTNKHSVSEGQRHSGDSGERFEFRTVPLITPAELSIAFARETRADGAPAGKTLVLRAGWHPFVVDRVFWKDLT